MAFQFGAVFAAFLAAGSNPGSSSVPVVPVAQPAVQIIEPVALQAMLKAGQRLVLVDVRTPEEYAAGHLDGAIPMPLDTLEMNYTKLPRTAKLVIYCRSGHRSARAAAFLVAHGYDNVVSLNGGIVAFNALAK